MKKKKSCTQTIKQLVCSYVSCEFDKFKGRYSSLQSARYIHEFFFFTHIYFPAFGQAVVTGVVHSPPRFLPSIFNAHRVQQSHCSSIFHRVLLTHALALSASQFVHKKKSPRIYSRMHSGGFELTKLTYTRLEDNLIRHRGDRQVYIYLAQRPPLGPSGCGRLEIPGGVSQVENGGGRKLKKNKEKAYPPRKAHDKQHQTRTNECIE